MSYAIHPGRAFEDCSEPEEREPTFEDGGLSSIRVARKAHACEHCPCDRGIQPGERYQRIVGLDEDGDFFTMKVCLPREGEEGCWARHHREVGEEVRAPAAPCVLVSDPDPDNIPF